MIEDWAPSVTSATKPRYSVVVPVFNEGANIGAFCAEALAKLPPNYELLICYDFDADNTLPALEALPKEAKPANIRLVRNRLGRGVRWAIDAGMRAAEADIVLVTMADLSDDFSNVEAMLQRAEAGADVVCASRYMKGGQQIGGPKLKKFLSRTAGLTLKWFAGMPTHDPTNSFKAYRREFLRNTPIESAEGFALGIELTVKAHIAGLRVEEVPATWRDRTAGESRFKLMKWIPMYLRWYWLAMRKAWAGNAFWLGFLALAYLFALSAFIPTGNWPFAAGELDASWCMVLHWTHAHHVDFGRDFVFTYGPWGFILQGYDPQTYGLLVSCWVLITTAFFLGALKVSRGLGASAWARGIWLLLITAIAGMEMDQIIDVRMFAPTCIALLLYAFFDDLGLNVTTVLLMAALALLCQVKFSTTILTVSVLVVIAIDQARRRKIPWALAVFAVSYLVFWRASGQSFGSLLAYIHSSMEVAAGYSQGEPISMPTETVDVTWFILCSMPLLAAALIAAWRETGNWMRLWTPVLGLPLIVFVVFKAGYVRHDEHGMEGTTSLAILGLMVMAATWRKLEHPALKTIAVFAGLAPTILSWQSIDRYGAGNLPARMTQAVEDTAPRMSAAAGWLAGRKDYLNAYEAKLSSIRATRPLPALLGTVDIYGWSQSVALAYDMPYQPRPVFQSYLAYTPALEKLNADSLAGPRAPDTILFDLIPIDGHYYSMEDGLAWPQILTHYDLKSALDWMLILERSPEQRDFTMEPMGAAAGAMGRPISVPVGDDLIWASISVKQTLWGKLISTLDKPTMLKMQVHLQNGQDVPFRLLPENAAAGFLLSPIVPDRMSFATLMAADWAKRLAAQKVTSITVLADSKDGTTAEYDDDFNVTFQRLIIPHRDISHAPGMDDYLSFQDFQLSTVQLPSRSSYKPQVIHIGSRPVLLAPALTRLQTTVPSACDHLRVKFGMLDPSNVTLSPGQPRPGAVEFRIYISQLDDTGRQVGKLIWSRALDPDHVAADHGIQEADILLGLPPTSIILETAPDPKHPNGLSYWAGVQFHQ